MIVKLRYIYLSTVKYNEDLFMKNFDEHEKKRSSTIINKLKKQNFITCRYILKKILKEEIGFLGTLQYKKNGKPYILDNPIYFNISHSHNLLLIATSTSELGVDTEWIDPERNIDKLKDRVLTKTELLTFSSLSATKKRPYFFSIWSQKEALTKLSGEGLLSPFNQLQLHKEDLPYLTSLDIDSAYQSFLATPKKADIKIFPYSLES